MQSRKRGFTLVEVIVTTIVIGVIAAIVIPAVAKQVTAGDPARMASDLGAVKSAIEVFGSNVRPKLPGDIEDLVNPIDATNDQGVDGTSFSATQVTNWKGPYVEWSMVTGGVSAGNLEAFKTANSYTVLSDLTLCDATAAGTGCVTSVLTNAYVTVVIDNVASGDYDRLELIIDGSGGISTTGLVRRDANNDVFFLASPYTAP